MNRHEKNMHFLSCLNKHILSYSELDLSSRNIISKEDYNLVCSYAFGDVRKEFTTFVRAICLPHTCTKLH